MIHTIVSMGTKAVFELFPMVWLILVLSILVFGGLKSKKKLSEAGERHFRIFLVSVALGFIGVAVILGIASRILLFRNFAEAFALEPAFIEFEWNGETTRVERRPEIRSFKQLLDDAPDVGAHHSHPTGELTFQVAGCATRFVLGKDSQNQDEFWLKCRDPRYGADEFILRQFHSPALTTWLARLNR